MNRMTAAPHVIQHWTRSAKVYVNSALHFSDEERVSQQDAQIWSPVEHGPYFEQEPSFDDRRWDYPEAEASLVVRARCLGSDHDEPMIDDRHVDFGGWAIDLVSEARESELILAFRELRFTCGQVEALSRVVGHDPLGRFWAVSCEGLGRMLQYVRVVGRWKRLPFGGQLFYDAALWRIASPDEDRCAYGPHAYGRRPPGRPARREVLAIFEAWADAGGDGSERVFNAFLRRHVRVSHLRFLKADMVRPLLKAIRTTQAGRLEPPAPGKSAMAVKGKGKPGRPSRRPKSPKVVPLFRERPAPSPSFGPYDGAA